MAALGLHTVVEAIVGAVYKVSPGNELHTEPSGEDVVIAYRESTAHHHALMLMVVQVSYADLFYIITANDGIDSEEQSRESAVRPESVFWLETPVFPFVVTI